MDFVKKPELVDAIKSLKPNSTFRLSNGDFSTLVVLGFGLSNDTG